MTSKRQVTFPKVVVERLHLKAGDRLAVQETGDGILIRPHRFEVGRLAPLREKISQDLPAPNFDALHHASLDPRLRD